MIRKLTPALLGTACAFLLLATSAVARPPNLISVLSADIAQGDLGETTDLTAGHPDPIKKAVDMMHSGSGLARSRQTGKGEKEENRVALNRRHASP